MLRIHCNGFEKFGSETVLIECFLLCIKLKKWSDWVREANKMQYFQYYPAFDIIESSPQCKWQIIKIAYSTYWWAVRMLYGWVSWIDELLNSIRYSRPMRQLYYKYNSINVFSTTWILIWKEHFIFLQCIWLVAQRRALPYTCIYMCILRYIIKSVGKPQVASYQFLWLNITSHAYNVHVWKCIYSSYSWYADNNNNDDDDELFHMPIDKY